MLVDFYIGVWIWVLRFLSLIMVHWQCKDVLHSQPIACCQFIFSFNHINTKTKINPQQKLPDSSSMAVSAHQQWQSRWSFWQMATLLIHDRIMFAHATSVATSKPINCIIVIIDSDPPVLILRCFYLDSTNQEYSIFIFLKIKN